MVFGQSWRLRDVFLLIISVNGKCSFDFGRVGGVAAIFSFAPWFLLASLTTPSLCWYWSVHDQKKEVNQYLRADESVTENMCQIIAIAAWQIDMHRSLCYNSAEPLDLRYLFWSSPFVLNSNFTWKPNSQILKLRSPEPFSGRFQVSSWQNCNKLPILIMFFFLPQVDGFHRQVPFRTAGDALLGRRNLEIEFEEQP